MDSYRHYILLCIDGVKALPADRTPLSIPSAGVAMIADGVQPLSLGHFISC